MFEPNPIIFNELNFYEEILKEHFEKYHNHCQRVYQICIGLDKNKSNHEKYAIVLVFHDLGIWTNQDFDYLEPSIELAKNYLIKKNKSEFIPEISEMINLHHKLTPPNKDSFYTTKVLRKADLRDLSFGLFLNPQEKKEFSELKKTFPFDGFHFYLIKLFFINLFKKPLKPLPMFKC